MQLAVEEIGKYRPECFFLVKSFRRRKVWRAMIATITMIAMTTHGTTVEDPLVIYQSYSYCIPG